MYITCKCLNVTIKTRGELTTVSDDDLDLSPNEKAVFLKNDLSTTSQLDIITKEQPGLVEIKTIGQWAVHRCFNCNLYTHAVHRVYGAAKVLINNSVIISQEEVEKLKACPHYSPIFRIIINSNKEDELGLLKTPSKYSVSHLSSNLRLALGGIDKTLEDAIHCQTRLTDEKIRAFTEEQCRILEIYKERAHNERAHLARLISNEQKNEIDAANFDTPPLTPETIRTEKPVSDAVDAATLSNTPLHQQSSLKPVKADHTFNIIKNGKQCKDRNSYDDETLFELEGMDDISPPLHNLLVSDHDSDTEDSGNEEAYISRSRSDYGNLARSLPVNVPPFCNSYNGPDLHDDDYGKEMPREPIDPNIIQASIKALAKSVHGDAPFGDLPRPRFSTQI
ncbi:uncharacterized protein LOC106637425 [Copidosoma floridanum]|uniref:uncharacterized protein LOC106637425 n=1 Tax=Copidosoma floridanum TaxID=29053 RepID=UPI0006C98A62|nr:uncharacterized protein LOC106637425 [Copidosoma floridanum]XP_014205688.1 uncharacterized protein LOC106637425 [Copidosoma floridanum]